MQKCVKFLLHGDTILCMYHYYTKFYFTAIPLLTQPMVTVPQLQKMSAHHGSPINFWCPMLEEHFVFWWPLTLVSFSSYGSFTPRYTVVQIKWKSTDKIIFNEMCFFIFGSLNIIPQLNKWMVYWNNLVRLSVHPNLRHNYLGSKWLYWFQIWYVAPYR